MDNNFHNHFLVMKASIEKRDSDFTYMKSDMKKRDYEFTNIKSDINDNVHTHDDSETSFFTRQD